MKKIFTLTLLAATALAAGASNHTFASLAATSGSGVTAQGRTYTVTQDLTIAPGDTLTLQDGDTIKLADKVTININGYANFAPAVRACVTRATDDAQPKGFRLYDDNAAGRFSNIDIDYAGISFGSLNGALTLSNCVFRYYNAQLASGACVNFSRSNTVMNQVTDCEFRESQTAAIGNGANTPVGITIKNCRFYHNNTKNSNRPQINLTCAGALDVLIEGNKVYGGQFTKVGGIGVSNMLGYDFSNTVTLRDNDVQDNRYGIALIGPANLRIEDNSLLNNHYETNANNGGSGISIYDTTGKGNIRIKGNHIEGSLWGITIIGAPKVNAGHTAGVARDSEDYNEGLNTFKDNGNGGVLYDLYNNGTGTVYAQNCKWNVAVQDSASIAQVVWDQADNAALGQVIYMPAFGSTAVNSLNADAARQVKAVRYFDLSGRESARPLPGLNLIETTYTDGTRQVQKAVTAE